MHNRVIWRLRWPYPRDDQRLTSPNTIWSNRDPPWWSASAFNLTPVQGKLGIPNLRFLAPQQFAASTSITALHVDSITTQTMFMVVGENSTEELKNNVKPWKLRQWNREWKVLIPLYPQICCGQLTNQETRVRAHGLPQCLLSIKAWCWINKNSGTLCVKGIICPCLTY